MPAAKGKRGASKAVQDVRKGAGRPGKKKAAPPSPKKKKGSKKAKVEEMLTIDAPPVEDTHYEDIFPPGMTSSESLSATRENTREGVATGSNQIHANDLDALDKETAALEDHIFDGEAVLPPQPAAAAEKDENEIEMPDSADQDDMDFAQIQESMPKEIPAAIQEEAAAAEPEVPKSHFDQVLESMKTRKKIVLKSEEEKRDIIERLIERMRHAAQDDVDSIRRGGVAAYKLKMLDQLLRFLADVSWHDPFVQCNGVHAIGQWLEVLPNGARPNMTLESKLLKLLAILPISSEKLKQAGVGRIVRDIAKDPHTAKDCRLLAQDLITRWMRQLFSQSTSYSRRRAEEQDSFGRNQVEKKRPAKSKEEIKAEAKESNQRRHPQMFQKATDRFYVAPDVEALAPANKVVPKEERSRKDSIKSRMTGLHSTSSKVSYAHSSVNISGSGMNVSI